MFVPYSNRHSMPEARTVNMAGEATVGLLRERESLSLRVLTLCWGDNWFQKTFRVSGEELWDTFQMKCTHNSFSTARIRMWLWITPLLLQCVFWSKFSHGSPKYVSRCWDILRFGQKKCEKLLLGKKWRYGQWYILVKGRGNSQLWVSMQSTQTTI